MSWDAITNAFIVNDIGLNAWEEVDIVVKGGNYGYTRREGPEQLLSAGGHRQPDQSGHALSKHRRARLLPASPILWRRSTRPFPTVTTKATP